MDILCVFPAFSPSVSDADYCQLERGVRRALGLVVAVAGVERCLPHYRVQRPGYESHAVEFVAEGFGEVRFGGPPLPLRPGSVFSYGPGIAHEIRTDPERPMRKFFVDFFGDEAAPALRKAGLGGRTVRDVWEIESMRQAFAALLRDGRKPSPHGAAQASAWLRLILCRCAEAAAIAPARSTHALESWQLCRRTMDERCVELQSLSDLAAAVHMHPSHICRLFRRFGDRPPASQLTRLKMDRAAILLRTTTRLVKDIAAEVGYNDPLHFSRNFRKATGLSPTEWALHGRRKTGGGAG